MKIKDLKDRTKIDEIVLTIVEKREPRDFESKWTGSSGKVCDATGQDEDGDKVSVTLWNEEIDRVPLNARIRISNGWTSKYRNTLQVSAGKFGKLEVL